LLKYLEYETNIEITSQPVLLCQLDIEELDSRTQCCSTLWKRKKKLKKKQKQKKIFKNIRYS